MEKSRNDVWDNTPEAAPKKTGGNKSPEQVKRDLVFTVGVVLTSALVKHEIDQENKAREDSGDTPSEEK